MCGGGAKIGRPACFRGTQSLSLQRKVVSRCKEHPSVAVVVPCHRFPLTSEELLSWRSLEEKLPKASRFVIAPAALRHEESRLPSPAGHVFFPDSFFTYPRGYNALLLSSRFYETFREFDFLLIYQLDCLVCRDELNHWCGRNWDYVGAPWSRDFNSSQSTDFVAVGNGGFSLRRVDTALKVLGTRVRKPFKGDLGPLPRWWMWQNVRRAILALSYLQCAVGLMTVERFLRRFYLSNEDLFWGIYAKRFYPSFRVATPSEALSFAFETNPTASLEKNGGQLPFGCHAWARYDRGFWEKAGVVPRESEASRLVLS